MSKRKHSEIDDGTADNPRKTRAVDGKTTKASDTAKDAKAKAAARQAKSERRSKKADNKSKPKRKRDREEPSALPDGAGADTSTADPFANHDETIPLEDTAAVATTTTETSSSAPDGPASKKSKSIPKSKKPKPASSDTTSANHRFILFIGNLPYTTTTASLTHHFRALQPFTIRHSTEKTNPNKSKGFAFLEFTSYDRMKTCLKLYHHSLFDPDAHLNAQTEPDSNKEKGRTFPNDNNNSKRRLKDDELPADQLPQKDTVPQHRKRPQDKTRRINVELTAGGGGGKSTARKDKIRNKNAKLAEERERVHKKEVEEREKKEREGGGGGARSDGGRRGGAAAGRGRGTGANAAMEDGDRGNVHPSRMRHVRG